MMIDKNGIFTIFSFPYSKYVVFCNWNFYNFISNNTSL